MKFCVSHWNLKCQGMATKTEMAKAWQPEKKTEQHQPKLNYGKGFFLRFPNSWAAVLWESSCTRFDVQRAQKPRGPRLACRFSLSWLWGHFLRKMGWENGLENSLSDSCWAVFFSGRLRILTEFPQLTWNQSNDLRVLCLES